MFARWRRRWRRRFVRERRVLRRRVSRRWRTRCIDYGVPPAHTLVLPNPADVARFDAALLTRDVARERLGVPSGAHVIGAVGRLHPKKRPQLALEGFAALDDEFHLAFVGDGALRGELESSAAQLGVASRVHFSGRVADASRYAAAFDASSWHRCRKKRSAWPCWRRCWRAFRSCVPTCPVLAACWVRRGSTSSVIRRHR